MLTLVRGDIEVHSDHAFTVCSVIMTSQSGSQDSSVGRASDFWSKGCEYKSGRSGRRIFFSRVSLMGGTFEATARFLDSDLFQKEKKKSVEMHFECRIQALNQPHPCNLFCQLLFRVCSILLLRWHSKHPSHSAKSGGGRWLHLNMCTPLTQQNWSGLSMLSRHSVGTSQGNELTCNSPGTTQPQLALISEPLWTEPGLENGICVCKLISI